MSGLFFYFKLKKIEKIENSIKGLAEFTQLTILLKHVKC